MRRPLRSPPVVIESIRSFPRRRHLGSDAARLLRASGASVPSNTQRFVATKNVCDPRVSAGRPAEDKRKRQGIERQGKTSRGGGGIVRSEHELHGELGDDS